MDDAPNNESSYSLLLVRTPPATVSYNESTLIVKRFLFILIPVLVCAQTDVRASKGRALFRSNCAFCHGLTAEGGRGPNLVSAPLHHGDTESDIAGVIRGGVPGTTMPAFSEFSDEETRELVVYLQTLAKGAVKRTAVSGDAAHGRAVYDQSGCASCHRVGMQGGAYGPDLSRIGTARSIEYLRESIVRPSADIPVEYEGITVVRKDGTKVTGVRVNEDTFTVQLRTPAQRFAGFSKADLKDVVYAKESLMPAYARMPERDLNDLLAYLSTLRETASGSAVKAAEGVR